MDLPLTLDRLENAELVRRTSDAERSYIFKHVLTQDTAYASLLRAQRRAIHRAVAQAYEKLYPDQLDENAAVLAGHYAQAGEDPKTAAFAARAGDRAATLSAYAEARLHYAAALEALSRLPDTETNRRARIDTTIKQINATWGIDNAEQNLARLFQAEALAQSLAADDRSSLARVRYWIGRVYSYGNEHGKAAFYYDLVLTAAHESEDPELFGLASAGGGRTKLLQGDFGKAVPLLEQALPQLAGVGNWPEWILAKVSLAVALAGQGHYPEGHLQGEQAIQKALEWNDRTYILSARGMAARVEFMAGNLERTLAETRDMEGEADAANPLLHYIILGFKAWVEGRLGMHETARATMAAANTLAAQFGTRLIFADWFAAARAEIELNAGQTEPARRLAEAAVVEAQATGGIFSEGIAQRAWGQALAANDPNDPEAEAHLEKSLKLFEEGEAVIEAARTQIAWGKVLRARGDAQAAREHFEQAAAQFRAAGMVSDLEQAQHLIIMG